jgi:hypothetical protein
MLEKQCKRERDDVTDEEERDYAKCTDVRASQWRQVELYCIWQSSKRLYGAVPFFASYMLALH